MKKKKKYGNEVKALMIFTVKRTHLFRVSSLELRREGLEIVQMCCHYQIHNRIIKETRWKIKSVLDYGMTSQISIIQNDLKCTYFSTFPS